MKESPTYTPPKVWQWEQDGEENRFSKINRPIAGPTHDKDLPVGEHPLQVYSLATPNGVKVTVMLEELLALGIAEAEYDAWLVNIMEGDQFSSGFVSANPNSKIPALVDHSTPTPTRVFESAAIVMYLAEKHGQFLPTDLSARAECLSWVFWQMGSARFWGAASVIFMLRTGTTGVPINRFTMEVKRQLDVLDRNLAEREFICGKDYTTADIVIHPWYGALAMGMLYESGEFLDVDSYKHVQRWTKAVQERPAVKRGQRVNRVWGDEAKRLPERHSASDLL